MRQHSGEWIRFYCFQHISLTTCPTTQTSLLRALPTFVPVLLFPAMNTHMYSHPLTSKQLRSVTEELGYQVHGPIAKTLACGDMGELRQASMLRSLLLTYRAIQGWER